MIRKTEEERHHEESCERRRPQDDKVRRSRVSAWSGGNVWFRPWAA
jgi:hypothetical protein